MNNEGLSPRVKSAFYGSYTKLTKVQIDSEQPILAGHDVVVQSGTGSGKTFAVLAPLIQRHLLSGVTNETNKIVYIVPTKALANDIARRINIPIESLNLSFGIRHADAPKPSNRGKEDILITTPESLDVMLSSKSPRLDNVSAFILDEVHLLYNTQRGLQLGILIRRYEMRRGSPVQVIGLSATISSAKNLWLFLRPQIAYEKLAVIQGGGHRSIEAIVRVERNTNDISNLLDQIKPMSNFKILIFADSRKIVEQLAEVLQQSSTFGKNIYVHYSSISGETREETEKQFLNSSRAVCIATSTLELGIDIGDIDLVILYGMKGGRNAFIQRIGRGNRRSDNAQVLCFCPKDESPSWLMALTFLGLIESARIGKFDLEEKMNLFGAVVQQIFSKLREKEGGYIRLAELAEIFSPWPHLTRQIVDEIAESLAQQGYCRKHDFYNRIGATEKYYELEDKRLIWGNFPVRTREIQIKSGEKEIGIIPATNLNKFFRGAVFKFAGKSWQINKISVDGINVAPVQGRNVNTEVSYYGKGLGIDPSLIEIVYQMLLMGKWNTSDLATKEIEGLERTWRTFNQILESTELPFLRSSEETTYFTFASNLINQVICRYCELESYETDDLRISTREIIDFSKIPLDMDYLGQFAEEFLVKSGELTLFQSMLPPDLLRRDVIENWTRNPCYERILRRLTTSKLKEISGSILSDLNL